MSYVVIETSPQAGEIQVKDITATSITITWSPVDDATEYSVAISSLGDPDSIIDTMDRRYKEFTMLDEGTSYTITVTATLSDGTTSDPAEATYQTSKHYKHVQCIAEKKETHKSS